MYCPSCGCQASIDQKFCRGCGESLGQVSQHESVQSSAPGALVGQNATAGRRSEARDERSKYVRLGFILFWGGIMLAALMGILGDALTNLSWRLGKFIENLAALGAFVVLGGIGVMIYSRFFSPVSEAELSNAAAIPRPIGPAGRPARQVSGYPTAASAAPGSVTEHTTYSLDQGRPDGTAQRN